MARILTLVLTLVLLHAGIAAAQVTENKYTIIPGAGTSLFTLGNSPETVSANTGFRKLSDIKKVVIPPTAGHAAVEQMWISYQDLGLTFSYDAVTRKLQRIIVTSNLYSVKDTNIRVGSSADVIPAFARALSWGDATRGSQNAALTKITYARGGIEFWVDGRNVIYAIVAMPRASGTVGDLR